MLYLLWQLRLILNGYHCCCHFCPGCCSTSSTRSGWGINCLPLIWLSLCFLYDDRHYIFDGIWCLALKICCILRTGHISSYQISSTVCNFQVLIRFCPWLELDVCASILLQFQQNVSMHRTWHINTDFFFYGSSIHKQATVQLSAFSSHMVFDGWICATTIG